MLVKIRALNFYWVNPSWEHPYWNYQNKHLLWDPDAPAARTTRRTARWLIVDRKSNRVFVFTPPRNLHESNRVWRFLDDGNGGWHQLGIDLVLHLARRDLSFVAWAAVELGPLDEGVWVTVANHWCADFAAEALGMKSMVSSNHNRPGHKLRARLTALAKLAPVIVFAE